LQPNGDPTPWGIGHLQGEIISESPSAQVQDVKPTRRLLPHLPSSVRIAATNTLNPIPTISKQQVFGGTSEENENGYISDENVGEILASMSRADALRRLPTAVSNDQDPSTSALAAPSQSVFPVLDSKTKGPAGSHGNGASRYGSSPSNITFILVSLVVLCIEVAG
jgi:hypothetical protein